MIEITPKTKVGELLEHYPQLESVLLELSSAFASLKNPILRRTVAKVASLQQAASLGNMKIEDLVNRLRSEAGQEALFGTFANQEYLVEKFPDWYHRDQIVVSWDACETIESGGSPMNQVVEQLKTMKQGDIYELITPFVPAPLLEMLKSKGFLTISLQKELKVVTLITANH